MSADGTVQAVARMLESDDYARQVASDASALSEFELDEDETTMLQAAAAEGIERIYRPSGGESSEASELSEARLENVVGGKTGVPGLANYLNARSFSVKTQTMLSKAIFSRYGTRIGGNPTMQIIM